MTGESGHGSLTDQWRNLSFYTKGARLTGSKGRGGKSVRRHSKQLGRNHRAWTRGQE